MSCTAGPRARRRPCCAVWWRSGTSRRRPSGTSYLYRPARPAWQSLAGAADTLLDNTLEGMDGKLLAYMVKKSRLTPDDLAQLRAILDRAGGRRRPEEAEP